MLTVSILTTYVESKCQSQNISGLTGQALQTNWANSKGRMLKTSHLGWGRLRQPNEKFVVSHHGTEGVDEVTVLFPHNKMASSQHDHTKWLTAVSPKTCQFHCIYLWNWYCSRQTYISELWVARGCRVVAPGHWQCTTLFQFNPSQHSRCIALNSSDCHWCIHEGARRIVFYKK